MRVHSLREWQNYFKNTAVGATIGNFDGVHLGHRSLLAEFMKACKEAHLTPLIFTFCPHPELFFNPDKRHLITDYREKYTLLKTLGFEDVVEIDFPLVRELTGEEFAEAHLLSYKNLKLIWLGHDFTFGCDKADPAAVIASKEIVLRKSQAFVLDGQVVSSSAIRNALAEGELEKANSMLGRSFSVRGKVAHGKKMGRQIGFPTINIEPTYPNCVPRMGVYRVSVSFDGKVYAAAMNVGVNPSVGGEESIKLEAHLIGFSGDLYDKYVKVDFEEFIRNERKFENLDLLKAQIKKDIEAVEASLG